jgi:hypothetical protein
MSKKDHEQQLEQLRRKQEEAKRAMEEARRMERDLLVGEKIEKHPAAKKLVKQLEEMKKELHRLRIQLKRRAYSVDCKERDLREAREALEETEAEEAEKTEQYEALQKDLEKIKDELHKQMTKQTSSA